MAYTCTMPPERPDPDALLRGLQEDERRRKRGRLTLFFGAAPGVGKTYAMLEAAQKHRSEGTDVVIGWVETHGRAETAALAEGLEALPPLTLEYRGLTLRELDLEAALTRRPALLVLDELAHTNAPGVRHAKRWEDVEELLDAGIDVSTTLNVQHLVSLNDVVNQITGITVRETVPDHVLDNAEVEFVDLPPDGLLQRLAEGKVYVPEQAQRAVDRFFRKGNLIALRELALRRTAERVDAEMDDYRRDHAIPTTWPVAERILVCVRPHPGSDRLVRAARRMAARLRAEWIVAYVESPSQRTLTREEREALAGSIRLAEQLGAETAVLSGADVAAALVAFARERNVSRIVVGKPAHPRWRDRLRGSLLDDIVRLSAEIDVSFISGAGEPELAAPFAPFVAPRRLRPYVAAAGTVAVSTALCGLMTRSFDKSNLIMIFLLGVAFAAVRFGRGPSILAAILSVAAFDFFFVPPHLTFAVSDTQYVITFAVMLVVALLISTLSVRVREHAEFADQRERRTRILYAMSRELAGLATLDEIGQVAARHVSSALHGPAVLLTPDAAGDLSPAGSAASSFCPQAADLAVARWVLEHGQPAGLGTDTLPAATALFLPVAAGGRSLAVLAVAPPETQLPLTPDQTDLLAALAQLAGAAIERVRLVAEKEEARLAVDRERLRSTLLSSVSHDLRTPLAAITGASTSLLADEGIGSPTRQELLQTIREEAERLNHLVGNLLEMTRLESGGLGLQREWYSIEEVVGSALARLEGQGRNQRIATQLAPDLPLVLADAVLLEQLLVNLLDNALKYGGESQIELRARATGESVEIVVRDEGPGLPPGAEDSVFEKFYRGPSATRGFGLGLAICRAIATVHGGTISAENRAPRGAAFRLVLPVGGTPPAAPDAEAQEAQVG
jgi:two-component system, OmpR family, sensor histidine kinase KdpD